MTKILLYNTGYELGLNGSVKDYIFKFYRYIHCPKNTQNTVLKSVKNIIKTNQPDICCFVELRKKNTRFAEKDYPYYTAINKYGKSILSKMPFFKDNHSAILSKKYHKIKKHYFKNGTKKLIYEVFLQNKISLFIVHLSLMKKTRKKQFNEIRNLIRNKDKVIICGDFNIYKGYKELNNLLDNNHLKVTGEGKKTFPSYKPRKELDLFLCSENINVKKHNVINNQFSDHLPLILEIKT